MKILVTGGIRSGKSAHAESLLPDDRPVTYVAAGPAPDGDPDWAARVAAHRARRPVAWRTEETADLAAALDRAEGPVLVDCLGTWLTRVLDEASAWDRPAEALHDLLGERLDQAVAAVRRVPADVVLVTNEVGLSVVPAHRSGRVFADLLGTVNQRVAAVCDEVHLVIAGRVLRL